MKAFRSIFKAKSKDENKENADVSKHVAFEEDKKHRRSDRPNKRNVYCNFSQHSFDDMSHPTSAYHVPTKPRAHRPTRSCPGGPNSPNGQASSSEDDQSTLKSGFFARERVVQIRDDNHTNRKYYQKLELNGIQTSEYGSADPSPVSDALRFPVIADRYDSHRYTDELVKYKNKYRFYRTKLKALTIENEKLMKLSHDKSSQLYHKIGVLQEENQMLKEQNNILKIQNSQFKNELYRSNNNILSAHQHGTFPNYYNQMGFYGAGEQMASTGNMPSSGPSSIAAPFRNFATEDDETKNFRLQKNSDPMDDSSRTTDLSISPETSMEKSRADNSYAIEEDITFVKLKDEGYSTTQSNQTLAQTTPVKPILSERLAKNRETL